jgi:WD40 repeat protein
VDTGVDLHGHTNAVNAVAFSPDGTLAASASLDETASIWDAATGRELHRLIGDHSPPALHGFGSARFTPDGRKLLTAQENGGVVFWDVSTGDRLGTCCERSGWWAESADFLLGHPDRIIVQYEDSEVHVWDVSQDPAGLDMHTFAEGAVYAFAVARDGRTFVTVGRDDKMARVWAASDLHQLSAWHLDLVNSIGLSPDGSRVISAGKDGVVRVMDATTGAAILQLGATPSPVMMAVYSVDGFWIVGGLANGTTRIWASDGHMLADLPFQTNSINALDTTADGRIVAGSDDRSAKIFTCQICGTAAQVIEQARSQAAVFDPSAASSR